MNKMKRILFISSVLLICLSIGVFGQNNQSSADSLFQSLKTDAAPRSIAFEHPGDSLLINLIASMDSTKIILLDSTVILLLQVGDSSAAPYILFKSNTANVQNVIQSINGESLVLLENLFYSEDENIYKRFDSLITYGSVAIMLRSGSFGGVRDSTRNYIVFSRDVAPDIGGANYGGVDLSGMIKISFMPDSQGVIIGDDVEGRFPKKMLHIAESILIGDTIFIGEDLTSYLVASDLPLSLSSVLAVDLNGGGNYTTITAALTAATPGDIIEVAPGTYVEEFTIGVDSLTLRGIGGRDNIIIRKTNGTPITANKVETRIENLTVELIQTVSGSGPNAVTITAGNTYIDNCILNVICSSNPNTPPKAVDVDDAIAVIRNSNIFYWHTSDNSIGGSYKTPLYVDTGAELRIYDSEIKVRGEGVTQGTAAASSNGTAKMTIESCNISVIDSTGGAHGAGFFTGTNDTINVNNNSIFSYAYNASQASALRFTIGMVYASGNKMEARSLGNLTAGVIGTGGNFIGGNNTIDATLGLSLVSVTGEVNRFFTTDSVRGTALTDDSSLVWNGGRGNINIAGGIAENVYISFTDAVVDTLFGILAEGLDPTNTNVRVGNRVSRNGTELRRNIFVLSGAATQAVSLSYLWNVPFNLASFPATSDMQIIMRGTDADVNASLIVYQFREGVDAMIDSIDAGEVADGDGIADDVTTIFTAGLNALSTLSAGDWLQFQWTIDLASQADEFRGIYFEVRYNAK